MALIYLSSLYKEGVKTVYGNFCQWSCLRSFGLGIIKEYFMSKEMRWFDCFNIDNSLMLPRQGILSFLFVELCLNWLAFPLQDF